MSHQPSADQFLKTFEGRIYRPTARNEVLRSSLGWSSSGDDVGSISLEYLIGKSKEPIIVESSIVSRRQQPLAALIQLVSDIALTRRPRFPVILDRSTVRVQVEKRERSFTVYSAGTAAVAITTVGDFSITIRCALKRLPTLSLDRLSPDELRHSLKK
jgi:hypothetical protein